MADLCPCGQPLHYSNRRTREFVEDLIADLGPTVRVIIPQGTYLVPRHYIALHGLKAWELPALAVHFGWAREGPVPGTGRPAPPDRV